MKTFGMVLIVWGAMVLVNLQLAWLMPHLPSLNVAGHIGPRWAWWLAGISMIVVGAVLRDINAIKRAATDATENHL